jgi:hypothetical protein
MDEEEPALISPGEVELWLYDDPCTLPATRSNPISARHTRPSSPSLPDSPAAPVCRRITSGGRYKVPLPCPIEDDTTSVQSTSYMPAPSRGCSLHHPLSTLFPLMLLLITSSLPDEPSPTTDAAPPRGHYISHTPFTPSTPGGWHEP